VLKKRFWALLLVVCLLPAGCAGKVPQNTPAPLGVGAPTPEAVPTPDETPPPIDSPLPTSEPENSPEVTLSPETPGLTSANVRLFFVDDGVTWQHRSDMLFDLSKVEHYHEFVNEEWKDLARIVFTTETTVREFSFLRVVMNDNFYKENPEEGARRYIVLNTIYTLDELTTEIPLVVTGASMGCIFADNGFSFVDEDGATRYFAFLESGTDGEGLVMWEF
jgi:hypothetical protein